MADWTRGLNSADLAFVKHFVLASGSLKSISRTYGVSYPTVRSRLDRLIDKIEISDSEPDTFTRHLRIFALETDLPPATVNAILNIYYESKVSESD